MDLGQFFGQNQNRGRQGVPAMSPAQLRRYDSGPRAGMGAPGLAAYDSGPRAGMNRPRQGGPLVQPDRAFDDRAPSRAAALPASTGGAPGRPARPSAPAASGNPFNSGGGNGNVNPYGGGGGNGNVNPYGGGGRPAARAGSLPASANVPSQYPAGVSGRLAPPAAAQPPAPTRRMAGSGGSPVAQAMQQPVAPQAAAGPARVPASKPRSVGPAPGAARTPDAARTAIAPAAPTGRPAVTQAVFQQQQGASSGHQPVAAAAPPSTADFRTQPAAPQPEAPNPITAGGWTVNAPSRAPTAAMVAPNSPEAADPSVSFLSERSRNFLAADSSIGGLKAIRRDLAAKAGLDPDKDVWRHSIGEMERLASNRQTMDAVGPDVPQLDYAKGMQLPSVGDGSNPFAGQAPANVAAFTNPRLDIAKAAGITPVDGGAIASAFNTGIQRNYVAEAPEFGSDVAVPAKGVPPRSVGPEELGDYASNLSQKLMKDAYGSGAPLVPVDAFTGARPIVLGTRDIGGFNQDLALAAFSGSDQAVPMSEATQALLASGLGAEIFGGHSRPNRSRTRLPMRTGELPAPQTAYRVGF